VTDARQKHSAAYTRWTEEDDVRLASEAAHDRTVEELAHLFGRKPERDPEPPSPPQAS
jgi:hypothetical protein